MNNRMPVYIAVLFFLLFSTSLWAQNNFSAASKRLNKRIEKSMKQTTNSTFTFGENEKILRGFSSTKSRNQIYVDALVKVNDSFDSAQLKKHGIIIRKAAGSILPLKIPANKLVVLAEIEGIEYLEVDTPVKTKLDSALVFSGVEPVYEGIGLSRPYTGKGVVIGILDGGFDYMHPMFYDSEGTLRVARGWDQQDDYGTPPQGFGYGTELVTYEDFWAVEVSIDAEDNSHGSHVAGIAGGSACGSGYRGMAPESDLIFVTLGGGNSTIVDGANYIFDYAEAQGKPAVINMSLGSHIGPHDGTSLLDQAFDSLVGPGRILVGAAGNEGSTALHLKKDFNDSNDVTSNDFIRTFMMFEPNDNFGSGTLEIWGSESNSLEVEIVVVDFDLNEVYSSGLLDSDELNGVYEFYDNGGGDEVYCEIAIEPNSPLNGKPNIQIYAENNREDYTILIEAFSPDGVVEMWNHGSGYGAPLVSNGVEGLVNGDINSTIGEIGGTSNSVITVGAYTTKNVYTDYLDQEHEIYYWAEIGEIADFSSRGPTADGRIKPDIAAPGNVVVSASSSYDNTLQDEQIVEILDEQWPMIALEGTSMATPCVAGITALLLQADPTLTKDNIVDLFWYSAIMDKFTGYLPNEGDNTWGLGKINAYTTLVYWKRIYQDLITMNDTTTFVGLEDQD